MQKIVVPIDGSAPSIRALKFAVDRQRLDEDLKIIAINVQPDVKPSLYIKRAEIEQWKAQEIKKVTSNSKIKSLMRKSGAEFYAESGDVAAIIVGYAKKSRCREIIMGTRGNGILKGLLLGSVATKVAQLAPMPVTLVK